MTSAGPEINDTTPTSLDVESDKPLDLRRIRHFVAVAELLNFRRAAERLNMTQPPLTVSIQKLEAELGTRLFKRETKGVSLTASGQAVLVEARKLLFHGHSLHHAARGVREGTGGTLRVGFVGSATYGMLQRLLPPFRARYPRVELVLREATTITIMRQLEDNLLDIGLVRTPLLQPSPVQMVDLEADDFVVALPADSALATRQRLSLADLAREPFIMYVQDHASGLYAAAMIACQQAGFVPRVTQQAVQVQTVLALVESGLGIALVPSIVQRVVNDRIVYRTLAGRPKPASIALALAYVAEHDSQAGNRFRDWATRIYETAPDG